MGRVTLWACLNEVFQRRVPVRLASREVQVACLLCLVRPRTWYLGVPDYSHLQLICRSLERTPALLEPLHVSVQREELQRSTLALKTEPKTFEEMHKINVT